MFLLSKLLGSLDKIGYELQDVIYEKDRGMTVQLCTKGSIAKNKLVFSVRMLKAERLTIALETFLNTCASERNQSIHDKLKTCMKQKETVTTN